jgi:dihydroorotase
VCVEFASTSLVHQGLIRLPRLIELLSTNPARILNVPAGTLSEGAIATCRFSRQTLRSRSIRRRSESKARNTPLADGTSKAACGDLIGGRTVYCEQARDGADVQ